MTDTLTAPDVTEQQLRTSLGESLAALRSDPPAEPTTAHPAARRVYALLHNTGYTPGRVTAGPRALSIGCRTVQGGIALIELFIHAGARDINLHRVRPTNVSKTGHRVVVYVSYGLKAPQ